MVDLFPVTRETLGGMVPAKGEESPPFRSFMATAVVCMALSTVVMDVAAWPFRIIGATLLPFFDRARDVQDTQPVDSRDQDT